MIGSGVVSTVFLGLSVLLQTVPSVKGDAGSWAMPVAYVAAVVFVVIVLAAVYLILSALRQRQREDEPKRK